ncbi:MAG: hypothetical protein M1834_006307 [Cirrosporium novae-zelandiae]|nr:MAG: hypothetical protein M1834_006307 [Cirrosporium novae-zelandiae]
MSRPSARTVHISKYRFYLPFLLLTFFAALSILSNGRSQSTATTPALFRRSQAFPQPQLEDIQASGGKEILECRLVHNAIDQCAFIHSNCPDEDVGLLSYLQLYYCRLAGAKPVAFIILALWLCLLFSTIGIAASDFFCINLSTIANLLGLSQSMAGVTFLAFGNGSPDVFSTFAAMSTNSGSLAIGELIGAAGFITAVVAGSMAIVRPFRVARKSFIRDVGFFVVAASFSMVFLADGSLYVWECVVMVGFYAFYVTFVVSWHWYTGQRRRRNERQTAARSNFYISGSEVQETLEPYQDDDDPTAGEQRSLLNGTSNEDFGALERNDVPEIRDDEEDDETRGRRLAELRNNMRINRPAPGERRNTLNPIRPSLVGALEFQALLSSLNKSRNIHSINLRRYSDDPTYRRLSRAGSISTATQHPQYPQSANPFHGLGGNLTKSAFRARAVSTNDAENLRLLEDGPRTTTARDFLGPSSPSNNEVHETQDHSNRSLNSRPVSPTFLSPPQSDYGTREPSSDRMSMSGGSIARLAPPGQQDLMGDSSRLLTPEMLPKLCTSHSNILGGTPMASPFPMYSDEPSSAVLSSVAPSFRLSPSRPSSPSPIGRSLTDDSPPRLPKWWPYNFLPPPRVLYATLFPTLYSWNDKDFWEKTLALAAAPSVLLLVLTLPVVESDNDNDGSDIVDPDPGLLGPEIDHSCHQQDLPENPILISTSPPQSQAGNEQIGEQPNNSVLPVNDFPSADHPPTKPNGGQGMRIVLTPDHSEGDNQQTLDAEEYPSKMPPPSPKEWNRWLVAVQIFTAPIFVVLIVWANADEQLNPRHLLLPILISLVVSLTLLAVLLLLTSPTKIPPGRSSLCFIGFVVSVTWISTIANEVVGVLKAFGIILNISDAILGLTIFAVGNSLGDLVADMTVAKLGYPVMALSACFGGPMLNILLGIGCSGLYMTLRGAKHKHHKHPNRPIRYKPYQLEISKTLVISGITLLITLIGLLILVPLNHWKMDRRIGWGLVTLWGVSTVSNVIVEVLGYGGEIA